MTLVVPLGNLECDQIVRLTDHVNIEPAKSHFLPIIKRAVEQFLIRHPFDFSHCLVVRNQTFNKEDKKKIKEFVEEIILLLRLFRQGSIFFNFIAIDTKGWYDNPANIEELEIGQIGVFFYMGWGHKGIPTKYELKKTDENELLPFVSKNIKSNLLSDRAYRYFFKAFHEPYSDDRFLDNAIGLENLLVNDTKDQSNIRYKFVDRGCFLLQLATSNNNGANHYVQPLKKIYDTRCKIVHSSKDEIDWTKDSSQDLLRNSENYLRSLLIFILEKTELRDSTKIDALKRGCYDK